MRLDDFLPHSGSLQEKAMEVSHNQCQDLKARYEAASSETKTQHEEALQSLRKTLLDTEERLRAAQEENSGLFQEMVELRKQADKAKVCSGREFGGCVASKLQWGLESSSRWDGVHWPLPMLTSESLAGWRITFSWLQVFSASCSLFSGVAATVQGFPLSDLCSRHSPPHAACSLDVTESLQLPELCLPACSRLCVVASDLGHLAAALRCS